jgi:putative nucleotidyltransferase with HDIG domain
MSRERLTPLLVLTAAAAIFPPALLHFFGRDQVSLSSGLHFGAVAGSAIAATAAGIALSVVGARRRDARAVLVGTAFSAMAAMLAVHGLASPGILVGFNGVVAFSGAATLPIGGAVLSLAALPGLRRPEGIRRLLWLQGVLLVGILAVGTFGILVPEVVPSVPKTASPAALAVLAIGLLFYGMLVLRALRTFMLGRRRLDLLVVSGLAWLGASLAGALLLDYQQLGWWLGHAFELVGIVLVGAPVVVDLLREAQSRPLAGDLRAADLVAQEEAFLGSDVRALTGRLAEKDSYTETHTRRVAMLAVRVGEELGLPPGRLRTLAIGGLLHDIGKLSVPDEILKKPGPLDEDELAVVRRHTVRGEKLLGELGFSRRVRRLVLDHHERLDGKGYPRGLGTRTIELDTKILTVCDVYDALISSRVYRPAWSSHQAIDFLREQAGLAFDESCVDALERVLSLERNLIAV